MRYLKTWLFYLLFQKAKPGKAVWSQRRLSISIWNHIYQWTKYQRKSTSIWQTSLTRHKTSRNQWLKGTVLMRQELYLRKWWYIRNRRPPYATIILILGLQEIASIRYLNHSLLIFCGLIIFIDISLSFVNFVWDLAPHFIYYRKIKCDWRCNGRYFNKRSWKWLYFSNISSISSISTIIDTDIECKYAIIFFFLSDIIKDTYFPGTWSVW